MSLDLNAVDCESEDSQIYDDGDDGNESSNSYVLHDREC